MTRGGRNLLIMVFAAIVVTVVLTCVSVIIYHNSGDIYLDRSRPGYLPDEEEIEEEPVPQDYEFPRSGAVTPGVLEEYLEHLQLEVEALDAYGEVFGPEVLSDEGLGI